MELTTFFAFLGAAYLLGIATTVMFLSLLLSPVDGIQRTGCVFRGLVLTCIVAALYLVWLGITM